MREAVTLPPSGSRLSWSTEQPSRSAHHGLTPRGPARQQADCPRTGSPPRRPRRDPPGNRHTRSGTRTPLRCLRSRAPSPPSPGGRRAEVELGGVAVQARARRRHPLRVGIRVLQSRGSRLPRGRTANERLRFGVVGATSAFPVPPLGDGPDGFVERRVAARGAGTHTPRYDRQVAEAAHCGDVENDVEQELDQLAPPAADAVVARIAALDRGPRAGRPPRRRPSAPDRPAGRVG
jgi:hypothetical protein